MLAFIGILVMTIAPSRLSAAEPVDVGDSASRKDVSLQVLDYDGIQRLIQSHRGKIVVMDAWSTSCLPCMKEFHNLVDLQKQYPDKVAAISLSFDFEGIGKPEQQKEKVLKFLREQGAAFDNVISSEDSDTLYDKFKLASVPAVFVYGPDGQLIKRFDNESAASEVDGFSYANVKKLVEKLARNSSTKP